MWRRQKIQNQNQKSIQDSLRTDISNVMLRGLTVLHYSRESTRHLNLFLLCIILFSTLWTIVRVGIQKKWFQINLSSSLPFQAKRGQGFLPHNASVSTISAVCPIILAGAESLQIIPYVDDPRYPWPSSVSSVEWASTGNLLLLANDYYDNNNVLPISGGNGNFDLHIKLSPIIVSKSRVTLSTTKFRHRIHKMTLHTPTVPLPEFFAQLFPH